ncbi:MULTISPECIES: hypothetical protein [unclassified Variovorax]|uniref:hypothetical protein n=1 Tax=unclassified Variovorax TaxID=663243 RepID=UPI003F453C3F
MLLIDDSAIPQMIEQMCCQGWNFRLLPDAEQREARIHQVHRGRGTGAAIGV